MLAARLSEDSKKSVLLLEAGDRRVNISNYSSFFSYYGPNSHEGNLWARIPLAFHKLFQSPADWNFYTTYVLHICANHFYMVILGIQAPESLRRSDCTLATWPYSWRVEVSP